MNNFIFIDKFDSRKTEVRHDFLGRERGRNLHVVTCIKLHQVKVQTSTLTMISRYMFFFLNDQSTKRMCNIQ